MFSLLVRADQKKSGDLKNGKRVFKEKCAACHSIHTKMIGPPLTYYTDSIKNIPGSFNGKSKFHKGFKITKKNLRDIQTYVNQQNIIVN